MCQIEALEESAVIVMEVVPNGGNITRPSSPARFCDCYKAAKLDRTISDTTRIANLKDRYVLGEQLGWGQFGVIRACSDKFTGEVLACKSIAKDRLVTDEDARSVRLEIEIMTRLSAHPNVVGLEAVYEDESYVHLVMELCAGGELFHRLEKQGRFSEHDAGVVFEHLMEVVKFCHENGVVHRDLKPENILLATTSSSSPIKLADFGLATYCEPGQKLHGTVGSPFYIAPEVLSGGYSQAADVWSTGVILYILLSGTPPFWGKTKSRIFDAVRVADLRFPPDPWDRISRSAKDLINGMLCVDPSKRLTAEHVLAHSWVKDRPKGTRETYNPDNNRARNGLRLGGGSFSCPFIARTEDYSFDGGSYANGDVKPRQSPVFTCKSSFRSDGDNDTPCSLSRVFSFRSCHDESSMAEFFSPISSMPSFTFFSPTSTIVVQGNISLRFKVDDDQDSCANKPLAQPDFSSLAIGRRVVGNGGGGTKVVVGIHGKRNRTIGLGEFTQLDVVVTESVIRWASCTDIPTAPSLRLSLVC